MQQWRAYLAFALKYGALFIGLSLTLFWVLLHRPHTLDGTRYLYIPPGDGLSAIAQEAETLGAVRNAQEFKLLARLSGKASRLRAGEYELAGTISPFDLLALIESGKTYQRFLTIAEGASAKDVRQLLAQAVGLKASTAELLIPEGSILPETYAYERGEDGSALLARMQDAMQRESAALWAERAPNLPLKDLQDAITLASVVEKETAIAAERPRVAAVFINRLRRGMRLQSDPTVIYGLTEGEPLGRPLRRSELRADTPYNTYRRKGLPAGPIANPGLESLKAVLNPPDLPYLYFVADGTGGHAFAVTLADHNRNVAQWRRIRAVRREQE